MPSRAANSQSISGSWLLFLAHPSIKLPHPTAFQLQRASSPRVTQPSPCLTSTADNSPQTPGPSNHRSQDGSTTAHPQSQSPVLAARPAADRLPAALLTATSRPDTLLRPLLAATSARPVHAKCTTAAKRKLWIAVWHSCRQKCARSSMAANTRYLRIFISHVKTALFLLAVYHSAAISKVSSNVLDW